MIAGAGYVGIPDLGAKRVQLVGPGGSRTCGQRRTLATVEGVVGVDEGLFECSSMYQPEPLAHNLGRAVETEDYRVAFQQLLREAAVHPCLQHHSVRVVSCHGAATCGGRLLLDSGG